MLLLSRMFIKAGLIYFVIGLMVGVLYMGQLLFHVPAALALLYPVYIHLLMIGWVVITKYGLEGRPVNHINSVSQRVDVSRGLQSLSTGYTSENEDTK